MGYVVAFISVNHLHQVPRSMGLRSLCKFKAFHFCGTQRNLISKDPTSNEDEFLSGLIVALGPEGKLYSPNNYTIVYQSLTITSFTNKKILRAINLYLVNCP